VTSGGTVTTTNVVVTGYGATTPLGGDAASTWDALLAGRSGVSRLETDWVERFDLPVRIAAQLAVEPTVTVKNPNA
jgi:3-oxoacyl-[acyl-carrier-protein] synthase II